MTGLSRALGLCVCVCAVVAAAAGADKPIMAGLSGPVGAPPGARVVRQLRIDRPGVYENIIVDGQWADADLVRIRADNVVLRNCTVRFGRRDAIEVYARNVLIENCKIHHVLAGTFSKQRDAHGITGRPDGLTVRNCEIYSTTRPFRLEDRVQNIRVFHTAYGPKVGKQIFQRAGGGSGAGFMDVGRRAAPPLPPWPYDRLAVGKIVPLDRTPQGRDRAVPTAPATGFSAAKSGLTLKPTPGGGRSLAIELFSRKK